MLSINRASNRTSGRTLALLAGTALALCGGLGSVAMADEPSTAAPAEAGARSSTETQTVRVGLIELEGTLAERPKAMGFGGHSGEVTLRDVLKALGRAAADERLKSVVIRLKDAELTMANIEEISTAIKEVRAAGKKVHLYAEGYGNGTLALASACDEAVLQSGGEVSLPGIYMEEMFLADTLKWIGVTPDFVQVGDYKGASEMFANSKPSKAWNENIDALLDAMYAQVRTKIRAGRDLTDAELDKAMEKAWMATGEQAMEVGLIDAVVDLPDLGAHIAKAHNAKDVTWDSSLLPDAKKKMEEMAGNPFAIFSQLMKKPDHSPKRDTIAVVHIDGAIVDGDSTEASPFGGEGNVGSRTIRRALSEIEDNDRIKGVIVRVNSPGGSAIASEIIWQGVQRVAKNKPVWTSVGSMAASGGYYIAVAGQRIYVNPSSIVGSIGVVGGKMALGEAMKELKINVVPRSRGPRAAMFGTLSPWSAQERAFVRQKMTETYELFTGRVKQGRTDIDLAKTAEGRLFVGANAIDLKMADSLGGINTAVTDLAAKLGLEAGKYDVLDYPAPLSFAEVLENAFGGFGAAGPALPNVQTTGTIGEAVMVMRTLLGEQNFKTVSASLQAMLQLRKEPVILVSPSVLIFK
jgi:protease-4